MGKKIIGIQLSNISMLHEGPENCLKFLKETAGINAAFMYAASYQMKHRDLKTALAPDHPVQAADFDYNDISNTFFKPDRKYFTGTPVFMEETEGKRFSGRDLMAEAIEAGQKLGIDIYARCLEPSAAGIVPGWHAFMSEDCYGRSSARPCWNNHYYQQWWMSISENLFKSYPGLAGFKFGSERSGPLSNVLIKNQLPLCFCRFCRAKGEQLGIGFEKAREGYTKLVEYVHGIRDNRSNTQDGVTIGLLRLFLDYPEILAWEKMQIQAEEHINQLLYGNVHSISKDAKFGIHVYHWQSWDPFYRAGIDYGKMARYADFIKPVVYHDAAGVRFRGDVRFMGETWMKEYPPQQIVDMFYAMLGYSDAGLPALDSLEPMGFNEKYVYSEVKRCVDDVKGKTLVLAGVGYDVPAYNAVCGKTPKQINEGVYRAVCAAFDAGADGILLSRESDEMRKANLEAAGRAIGKYM